MLETYNHHVFFYHNSVIIAMKLKKIYPVFFICLFCYIIVWIFSKKSPKSVYIYNKHNNLPA